METLSPLMLGDGRGSWSWRILCSPGVLCPRIWSMVYMGAILAWVLGSIMGVISGELDITLLSMTCLSFPRDHRPLTSCSLESQCCIVLSIRAASHESSAAARLSANQRAAAGLSQSEGGPGRRRGPGNYKGMVICWLRGNHSDILSMFQWYHGCPSPSINLIWPTLLKLESKGLQPRTNLGGSSFFFSINHCQMREGEDSKCKAFFYNSWILFNIFSF